MQGSLYRGLKRKILILYLVAFGAPGCQISGNLMYENKLSETETIKTIIELKRAK